MSSVFKSFYNDISMEMGQVQLLFYLNTVVTKSLSAFDEENRVFLALIIAAPISVQNVSHNS